MHHIGTRENGYTPAQLYAMERAWRACIQLCIKCAHEWVPRQIVIPQCPRCKSCYWEAETGDTLGRFWSPVRLAERKGKGKGKAAA